MTAPLPPSDADRIIAAADAQAHKTRVLLVWLLLGIPAAAGLVWAIVVGVASHTARDLPSGTVGTGNSVVQTADPMPTALLNTIDSTTSCAAVNEWATDAAMDAYTGGFANGVRGPFQSECELHPDETAGVALEKAARILPTG